MPDILDVFGVEYTGVAGFKASDNNGQTKVFVRPQGSLSITSNNTYDVSAYASAVVNVSGGSPNLQSKSKSYTPSETAQSETVSADTGYDGLSSVDVSVGAISSTYVGSGITRRSSSDLTSSGATVTAPAGYYSGNASKAIASGSATPASNITATGASVSSSTTNTLTMTKTVSNTPTVTAGYISSGTAGNSAISLTASVPTRGMGTITPTTVNQTIASGTYLTGAQTISGDANLVAGNIKKDVTIFGVTGTYDAGGGSSSVSVDYISVQEHSSSGSIAFIDLKGQPTSFYIQVSSNTAISPSSSLNYAVALLYDNSDEGGVSPYKAQFITNTSNAQVSYSAGDFYANYSNGTLEVIINSQGKGFYTNADYSLLYSYNGTAANVKTTDVQVGSGATSITFTNLEDEPEYWSCLFKSNFSTSSGYQRVIATAEVDDGVYGLEMDSSAHYSSSHWTWTYNNGSLTITSQGTNAGGYFHQPGYYQLTYVVGGDQSLQTKTVTPTEQTQNVTADSGYTALKKVVVNPIPSSYVQPTATKGATTYTPGTTNQTIASGTYLTGTQTISGDANLIASNIKSGTTIFGVTGSYTGGGGGSVSYDTKTVTASNYPVSLSFTSMKGEPKAFVCRLNAQVSSSGNTTYYYIVDVSAFGTTTHGNCFRIGSTRRVDNITSGYSWSYSGTTLTITSSASSRSSSPGAFYSGSYELLYVY